MPYSWILARGITSTPAPVAVSARCQGRATLHAPWSLACESTSNFSLRGATGVAPRILFRLVIALSQTPTGSPPLCLPTAKSSLFLPGKTSVHRRHPRPPEVHLRDVRRVFSSLCPRCQFSPEAGAVLVLASILYQTR